MDSYVWMVLIIWYLFFLSVVMLFGVVGYVLYGLGLFTIAKRRNLTNPWLAWVPLGNNWMLGKISDGYRYQVHGQWTNHSGMILGWSVATIVMSMISGCAVGIIAGTDPSQMTLGWAMLSLMIDLAMVIPAIVLTVLQYVSLFDLYRSCKPGQAVLFLLLSIFLSVPFVFVFLCRNDDNGLPDYREDSGRNFWNE